MFKLLFKHFIYEYCIEVALDNVIKSFPIGANKFMVGQKFDVFECELDDIWWGLELGEVVYCDSDLVIIRYASSQVHIPNTHHDLSIFRDDEIWENVGAYGDEMGEASTIFANYFGGTQVFPLNQIKDIDYF